MSRLEKSLQRSRKDSKNMSSISKHQIMSIDKETKNEDDNLEISEKYNNSKFDKLNLGQKKGQESSNNIFNSKQLTTENYKDREINMDGDMGNNNDDYDDNNLENNDPDKEDQTFKDELDKKIEDINDNENEDNHNENNLEKSKKLD